MKLSTVVYSALMSLVLSTTGVSATETPSRVLKGGKKDKKNRGKSVKYDFFLPSAPEQYDIRDPVAGVFATSGDGLTVFQPLTDPDDGSNVGTLYGTCTVLQPGATFYCNFTPVYDNNKGTSGSFTYAGVGFLTPVGGLYGTLDILGAQGDFQPKGTVSLVQTGPGQVISVEATFK